MTYPLDGVQVLTHIEKLLAHLPAGPMRTALIEQADDAPLEAFEALVAYYANDEQGRLGMRALFYALANGERVDTGPTSGELAEQYGSVVVEPLPDDLVVLCRTRLLPMIQEHSRSPDVDPESIATVLQDLGLADDDDDDNGDDDSEGDVPVFA